MAITTTCPSCQGPLRVPDELVGHRVRCPVCQNVFEAAGDAPPTSAPAPGADAAGSPSAPEQPLWKNLQLELDKSDPNGQGQSPAPEPEPSPAPPPSRRPGLVGAVEMKLSIDDEPAPGPAAPPAPTPKRSEPPPPRRPAPPPRRREDRDDSDDDYRGPRRGPRDLGYRRRDSEPHRGVLVLVLGIVSLACVLLSFCYGLGAVIGIPLGITAWVLGHGDLRKIKNNEMDQEGLGLTQAGWICGIIGTILNSLVIVSCGAILAFVLTMAASQAASTKPAFAPPPPPPALGK